MTVGIEPVTTKAQAAQPAPAPAPRETAPTPGATPPRPDLAMVPGATPPAGRFDVAACAAELIRVYAMTARIACDQITAQTLKVLHESVKRASCLPTRPGWEQKAAAHAELLRLLADLAGGPAPVLPGAWARLILDWMRTAGPAANGMITSSHQRLLAHLRAADADSAALEMENHLRALHYMWRLADRG